MPNVALIPNAATKIDALTVFVDGFPDAVHKLSTGTGSEPLEDGREATDHAVARQDQLVLTGWVSDFNGATDHVKHGTKYVGCIKKPNP